MNNLEFWISKEERSKMYTSDYWNNSDNEQEKEWWIEDEKDKKVLEYLNESGLKEEFNLAIKHTPLKGKILDLAAGTCWTSALLSKQESIQEIDAVEFSYHRINHLAPITINSLGGDQKKINRYLGSFYDIKRDKEYYDAVILSQAYHHAEFPLKLFHECDRVLKKGGYIIIIGEHVIKKTQIFRRIIKNLLKGKIKFDLYEEFYNHDCPLGDHYYLVNDYKFTFYAYGYSLSRLESKIKDSTIFIGQKL